jgi:hypothetical protein
MISPAFKKKVFKKQEPVLSSKSSRLTRLKWSLRAPKSGGYIKSKVTNPKVDILRRLQIFNGGIDLLLKTGAVSVILGALVIHKYLASLEAQSLFPQFIGSQAGLFAAVFGLGLVLFAVLLTFAISPVLLRVSRNSMALDKTETLLSFRRTFGMMAIPQIGLLAGSVVFQEGWHFLVIFLIIFLISLLSVHSEAKTLTKDLYLAYATTILGAQFFSIFSWTFMIPIFIDLEKSMSKVVHEDIVFILVFLIWTSLYSAATAAFATYGKPNVKEAWTDLSTKLAFMGIVLLYVLLLLPGNFFVNAAMKSTAMRQVQKESQWWYVNTAAVGVAAPDVVSGVFKQHGQNTYLCGYSPIHYPERVMLCPASVSEPRMKNCFVFQGSQVLPIAPPKASGWECVSTK